MAFTIRMRCLIWIGFHLLRNALTSAVEQLKGNAKQVVEMVERYWKFDDQQQPMASWHDKQALLERLRLLTPTEGERE